MCYAATENTKSQQNDGATISSVTFIRNEPEIKNKIHTHIRIGADWFEKERVLANTKQIVLQILRFSPNWNFETTNKATEQSEPHLNLTW